MSIDVDAMGAALEPTRKGLEAAGFGLALADVQGRLQLQVTAGKDACEDCLVPKSMMRQMARDEVREAGLQEVEIDILYPLDARRK